MSNTLFLNIDGVLADFSKQLSVKTGYALEEVQQFLQKELFDADEKKLTAQECQLKNKIEKAVSEKDFYTSMPVVEGARTMLGDLKKRFDKVYLFSRLITTRIKDKQLNEVCSLKKQWVLEKVDPSFPNEQILTTYMPAEKLMLSRVHSILIDSTRKNVNRWVCHYIRNANLFPKGATGIVFVNAQQLNNDLEAKGFVKTIKQASSRFKLIYPQNVRE